jgi:hypothetical protein
LHATCETHARDGRRVCRAWHEARGVKVFSPGFRRAEG